MAKKNPYSEQVKIFNKKIYSLNSKPLNCISLFSGALGLDIGLHAAGFTNKLCVDNDQDAYHVAKHNFPKLKYLCKDITKVSTDEIVERSGVSRDQVDLLAGGPPCQPFSKSGQRNGLNDERGNLFKHYIDILNDLRPNAFLLENVRGLYSSNKGKDFNIILNEFDKTGYTVYSKIIDASNYGVPQFRQRLFLIGFKKKIRFNFPDFTHGDDSSLSLFNGLKPFVTVKDAIGDLEGKVKGIPLTGKYKNLLADIPEGLNYSFYTKERGHKNPKFEWRTKFWYFLLKIDRKKPSLTIQAQPGNNTGPFHWRNRKLDIRELARLQTFPDWYEFPVSYFKAHKLIGNAVPCTLAYKLGVNIRDSIKEDQVVSDEHFDSFRRKGSLATCISGRGSGKGKVFMDA